MLRALLVHVKQREGRKEEEKKREVRLNFQENQARLGKCPTLPMFWIFLFVCVGFEGCFDLVLSWLEFSSEKGQKYMTFLYKLDTFHLGEESFTLVKGRCPPYGLCPFP